MKKYRGTLLLLSVLGIIGYLGQQSYLSMNKTKKVEDIIKKETTKLVKSRFTGEDFFIFMDYVKIIDERMYIDIPDSVVMANCVLNDTILTPFGYKLLAKKYSYINNEDTIRIPDKIDSLYENYFRKKIALKLKDSIIQK